MAIMSRLPEAISSALKIGPLLGTCAESSAVADTPIIEGSSASGVTGEVGGVWKCPTLDCLSVETDLFLFSSVAAAAAAADELEPGRLADEGGPLPDFFFEPLVIAGG